MIRPRLILCSGADPPDDRRFTQGRKIVALDTLNPDSNTHLRIENVTDAFSQRIADRLVDLLEIATYVYTADCEASRERAWLDDKSAEPWSRDFLVCMPVRDLTFWTREDVQDALVGALSFLSSDKFEFQFSSLRKERPTQEYLQISDVEDSPFYGVDRVTMFSGGLDALGGALETVTGGGQLVAVSHRPAVQTNKRQREIFRRLRDRWKVPMMHVPVWVNKSGFRNESTQRTRTFLFSALGAAVAGVLQAGGVRFYENGVTSLNWPLASEVLQSRASRSTHPETLRRLESFLRLVVGRADFVVDNPFIFHTKTDVVVGIAGHGAGDLIPHTCSCTHTMFQPKTQWHCGRCGQCIDRRIAVLASGESEHDSEDDYVIDVFTGPRKDGYDRNIGVSYARYARDIHGMAEADVATTYNRELVRAAQCFEDVGETARRLVGMQKRHAETVCAVLDEQVRLHSQGYVDGSLNESSMLAMIGMRQHVGGVLPPKPEKQPPTAEAPSDSLVFRKTGDYWTVVYTNRQIALKDTKGMSLIAYLLSHPHREYDPLELRRLVDGTTAEPSTAGSAASIRRHQFTSTDEFAGEQLMDGEYREHVRQLIGQADVAVAEAERDGDPERIRLAKAERQKLFEVTAGELHSRDGPVRRFRDDSQRARDALSKRVRRVLADIRKSHPTLHTHLANCLTLGTVFSYKPDRDLHWLTD